MTSSANRTRTGPYVGVFTQTGIAALFLRPGRAHDPVVRLEHTTDQGVPVVRIDLSRGGAIYTTRRHWIDLASFAQTWNLQLWVYWSSASFPSEAAVLIDSSPKPPDWP